MHSSKNKDGKGTNNVLTQTQSLGPALPHHINMKLLRNKWPKKITLITEYSTFKENVSVTNLSLPYFNSVF